MKPTQFTSNMIPQTILPGKQPAGRQPFIVFINLFKPLKTSSSSSPPPQKKSCTCPYISYVVQVPLSQKNPPISYRKNGSQQQNSPTQGCRKTSASQDRQGQIQPGGAKTWRKNAWKRQGKICWYSALGIQSYSQLMIGLSNHLLSIVLGFHYHSQKVIGSLGVMV